MGVPVRRWFRGDALGAAVALAVVGLAADALMVSARAHEVWIEPERFQVEAGAPTSVNVKNGERFIGQALVYLPSDFKRFEQRLGPAAKPIDGRMGDTPTARVTFAKPGLHTLLYRSTASTLSYERWEKFARFVKHKAFKDVSVRHEARGLPRTGFKEVYTRFAKALVAVGHGRGNDQRIGLETEIVAMANPFRTAGGSLPVQVLYRGKPRTGAQVEIFRKTPEGTVKIETVKTDARGIARVPIEGGAIYLIDAVVLREPSAAVAKETGAVWETLWASLTFEVPARGK